MDNQLFHSLKSVCEMHLNFLEFELEASLSCDQHVAHCQTALNDRSPSVTGITEEMLLYKRHSSLSSKLTEN